MQKYGIWFIDKDGRIVYIYQDEFVNRESAQFWAAGMVEVTPEYKNFVLKEIDKSDEL